MKTLLFIFSIFLTTTVQANVCGTEELAVCDREADIARHRVLAMELDADQLESVVHEFQRQNSAAFRQAQDRTEEFGCERQVRNAGLQDLLNFIENDFPVVQARLLNPGRNNALAASAERAAEFARRNCGAREAQVRQRLFQAASTAYETVPRGAVNMASFDRQTDLRIGRVPTGLGGFIQDGVENGAPTRTFAFTGSENPLQGQGFLDWFNNGANNGGEQLEVAVQHFLAPAVQWLRDNPRGQMRCTGHSLGGALAESFCTAVMMRAREVIRPNFGQFKSDDRIRIVTFNGLGAEDTWQHVYGARSIPNRSNWMVSGASHVRVKNDPLGALVPLGRNRYLVGQVSTYRSSLLVTQPHLDAAAAWDNNVRGIDRTIANGIDSVFNAGRNQRQAAPREAERVRCDSARLEPHNLDCLENAMAEMQCDAQTIPVISRP